MRPVTRATPALPVGAVKTYTIAAPLVSHWREAGCAEVDCQAYLHGWVTAVDETAELGQRQADYIRREAGRRYREQRTEAYTEFIFEAGQRCFRSHKLPLERAPLCLVRPGDWRGFTGPATVHHRPGDWVEDMQQTFDRVRTRQERG